MDARQQMAFAPLLFRRAWTEAATQHIAFALQGGQRVLLVGQADAQVGRQLPGRARPEATQAGAGQLHGCRFRRVRRRIAARRLESVGHLRRGMHQAHRRQALRRQPESAACAVQASGAALLRQLRKPFPPARIGLGLARGEEAQAVQRLMHLVGVARFGQASPRTASIASRSRAPRSSADSGSLQRRFCTAWVRRSSSGASSR